MKRLFTLLIIGLLSFSVYGQATYLIKGNIKDETGEGALGANVQIRTNTGEFLKGTSVNEDGTFILTEMSNGSYKVSFKSMGLKDIEKVVTINNADVDLGNLQFESEAKEVKGTTVRAARIAAQQQGDTTNYDAQAFKVNPDATAEDLVRKMPGIDLSSGQVKAQGEKVGKVLVDGKPFFGDDASSTLKNLPAEVISQIQVYDEKSEQTRLTGVDDGETIKAINIVTRIDKREGTFGKLYTGAGLDAQKLFYGGSAVKASDLLYNLGGNINSFKGDRRFSVVAQSNNINNQNFSSQDLLGIAGSSGGRGRGGRGGSSSDNFMVGNQSGIATTNAIGVNYSNKFGKKIELTASYFFNKSNTVTDQNTSRNYVSSMANGQTYNENTGSNAINLNHRLNARLTYNIDSQNTLLWIPSFSLQANNSHSTLFGETGLINDALNSTNNKYNSALEGYNYSNTFLYFHRFKKMGRSFNINSTIGGNQNKGTSDFYAQNLYFTNTALDDTLNQESTIDGTGTTFRTSVQYSEPLSKQSNIQLEYMNRYQKTNSSKLTENLDLMSNNSLGLDSLLSNKFTSIYQTNSLKLTYGFTNKLIRARVGLEAQQADLRGDRVLPNNTAIERSFQNLLPTAMMRITFSKSKNLGLFYRTSTSAPSITQLQDVVDNTNPLQLSAGNPNLKQSYSHSLFSRYSATNTAKNSTFFLMFRGTATQDYVGNSTIIANNDTTVGNGITLGKGGQFTTQQNLDGYYSLSAFSTYGRPITALKSNINLNLSGGLTRIPGLINGQKNFSNNKNLGLGVVFSSNISEKIDFTLSSNTSLNFVTNSLNHNADNNFLNQSTRLSANYIFLKNAFVNTELNHQLYSGLIGTSNQNFLLWNAGLGKKFLKNNAGELKLSVFDLLGQNASFTQTYTDAYNQTVNTNVLQRYFMLTFTYTIRSFKKGSTEKDMEEKGNFEGRPGGGHPH